MKDKSCLSLASFALAFLLSGCSSASYISIRNGSTDVQTRNFSGPMPEFYSFLTQPPLCVEGATAAWKIQPDVVGNQRGGFDLYAHAPFDVWITYFNMHDEDIQAGTWDSPSILPLPIRDVVVLPFPPADASTPSPESTSALHDAMFDEATQPPSTLSCQRVDSAGQRQVSDDVIAALAYVSGQCSSHVVYQTDDPSNPGVLQQIAAGLWDQFDASGDISNKKQKYTKAIGVIAQDLSNPVQRQFTNLPVDYVGAFLLAFNYSADIIGTTHHITGEYQYQFALQDGFLALIPLKIRLDSDWYDLCPFCLSESVESGLKKDIPTQFLQLAETQQSFPTGISCTKVTDCGPAGKLVASQISASILSANGYPSAASSVNTLKCTAGDLDACQANGFRSDPGVLADNWTCQIPPKSKEGQCALQLRAKRLIPHEDEVELVWFDGPEWFNAAFALAIASGGPANTPKLCQAAPVAVSGTLPHRKTVFISSP